MEPSFDTDHVDNSSGMSGICNEIIDLLPQLNQHFMQQPADSTTMNSPYIEILEQPKPKVRFRYLCEGRSAGAIVGINSTNDNKTYPTIRIHNYQGDAHIVVSCVTVDQPYRPHPHKLVDKENTCKDGIFFKLFNQENNEEMKFTLANVGIQCMKKKDIDISLKRRQEQGVDPFGTGFDHRKKPSSIELNAVRLCFQVFLPTSDPNEIQRLKPVVSEPIFDAKSNADLIIHQLSHSSASVAGDMKMILLCDKISNKDDIKIRFYEEQDGVGVVWESWGIFTDKDIHHQYAITFKTPSYRNYEISDPVDVKIQLVNSKDSYSDPCNFKFTPITSGRPIFWRYRKNKAQPLTVANLFPNINIGEEVEKENKVRQENDYASIDKSVHRDSSISNEHVVKPSVDENQEMEVCQVPDILFDNKEKEKVTDSFEDLLNEVSNLNDTLQQDNGFLLIEDSNNTAATLDQFNNNVNESSVVIQELDENKEHLGQRTEGFGSYSSLQLAMKNQYFIDRNSTGECYEDVLPPEVVPVVTPPPRPPSHTKPNLATLQRKSTSDKFDNNVHEDAIPPLPPKRSRRSGVDRNLPPVPKYKSFFHKLFFKNKSKSKPTTPRERSLSIDSHKIGGGGSINDDVMLTEAEHYALYTSVAPHATHSEFDEASFYYSPVEGLPSK